MVTSRAVRRAVSPAARPYSTRPRYDVAVIGGGIVGVATARELLSQAPNLRVGVFEKEGALAYHQTGRNSGVIV